MLKKFNPFKTSSSKDTISATLDEATKKCNDIIANKLSSLNIPVYNYKIDEAVEELGLDNELVHELLEDYVAQVIKASLFFEKYLQELKNKTQNITAEDLTPFRDLAHKNLGVARNLRIKDAEILLYEMMTQDDLEHLQNCLEALKACSIRLKPECAYKTLKLIEVKSSL